MITTGEISQWHLGSISPNTNMEDSRNHKPYIVYRGQPGCGRLKKDPWKALMFAAQFSTYRYMPRRSAVPVIIGDCGVKGWGEVPRHTNGGHTGGATFDVNYFLINPYEDNYTHYPDQGCVGWDASRVPVSILDNKGKLDLVVFDVPRVFEFLRILSLFYPYGHAYVHDEVKRVLSWWGPKKRGLDISKWLYGDNEEGWNHDKHMHIQLEGSPKLNVEFIVDKVR